MKSLCLLCLLAAAIGASLMTETRRTLLVEIPDVPTEEQTPDGLFYYGGYSFERIIRVVRDRAVLIATPRELEELRSAGYEPRVMFESSDELELYRRAIYGPEMQLSPVYWRYDQIIEKAEGLAAAYPI